MQEDWINSACDKAYQSVHGRDSGKDELKGRAPGASRRPIARPQKIPWPMAMQHPHIMVASTMLMSGEYTIHRDFADWDEKNKQWVIWLVPLGGE